MSVLEDGLYYLLTVGVYFAGYVAAPVLLVWGWTRWLLRPKQWTACSTLSLAGVAFASASALVAVSAALYSQSIGGGLKHFNDPLFMKLFDLGVLLSRVGIVVGIGGVWQKGSLRWHGIACAVGTLMFWRATGGD